MTSAKGVGLPIKLLHESEGHIVTVCFSCIVLAYCLGIPQNFCNEVPPHACADSCSLACELFTFHDCGDRLVPQLSSFSSWLFAPAVNWPIRSKKNRPDKN